MSELKFIYAGILFLFSMLNIPLVMADHASASFETGSAGAIMTTPGATLPRGEFVFGSKIQFIELDDISDRELETLGALDEDVHSVDNLLQVNVSLAYGVSNDLTIGVSAPYVERNSIREAHHDMGMGEAELAGDSSGIGDLSLFGQYRFFNDQTNDVAFLAGVKISTGDTEEREQEGELFEVEQQPGTGSWDPFIGLALNYNWGRTGFSANVLYTFTTEGEQQTELGDVFNYNLALNYRLYSPEGPHDHAQHQHAFNIVDYIDVTLELNGDIRDRVEINGHEEKHSGGHTVYLSPGIRIGLVHRWSIFTSAGIAVVNDHHGQQSEPDYRVIGGISVIF